MFAYLTLLQKSGYTLALPISVILPRLLSITLEACSIHVAFKTSCRAIHTHIINLLIFFHTLALAGGSVELPVLHLVADCANSGP